MGGRNEMGIKEMEKQTGISSQNIRYYEKQGLLSPKRNPENGYRIYGEEEAEQLKRIKLFRKLDMPIEDIRRMLSGEQSLQEALTAQKKRQEKEKKHLEAVLKFYGRIRETELDELQFAPHGGHWCVCQRPPGGAQRPPSLRYFDRLNNNNVMLRCPLHNSVG